ncbi:MAG: hypothetical protein JW993_09280 [Sedimentisphaerales bacterium]|nr:hypothetical protein [Sedimentisphaerales bacterium]
MRDLYKNPVFYYVLAAILIGIWPLLVLTVYLPGAREGLEADKDARTDVVVAITEILKLDPERLSLGDPNDSRLGKFSYLEAIRRSANLCGIPSGNYPFTTGGIITSQGKQTQTARLSLKDVGITQVARFLTHIQSNWVNLTCEKASLKKKEGMPDQWDVDLDFKYSY